ncbi:hypothetical protein QVD17_04494 [Tagetes erecta]|uniref:Uncharacterized protein n=1 Tax=Tagetes erecta TaxID=13708 RepID=A0AAD8LDA1_TARER|nr:hypothetical protein QVD17_04494 [Tagetes erecta]
MCTYNSKSISSSSLLFNTRKPKSKRGRKQAHVRIHWLNRENRNIEEKIKREMEVKNLKLYMENMNILKENEKLRKKASQLHQENLLLLSELDNKLCSVQDVVGIRIRQTQIKP